MEPIPVPSHIHYELLLQLLERQTLPALRDTNIEGRTPNSNKLSREQIQSAIIMLRKALALQKQFESNCDYAGLPITYRWSLNESESNNLDTLPEDHKPEKY